MNNEGSEALAMGKINCKCQVVYRDEGLEYFISGGWGFFQRPKECAGLIDWSALMRGVSGLSWIFLFRYTMVWDS